MTDAVLEKRRGSRSRPARCGRRNSGAGVRQPAWRRDGYYFPYVVEERLTQSLSAGDAKAVEDVLSLLQTENFVRRSLNRSRMRQLNRRIVEILSAPDRRYSGRKR